jgi:tricorn protease
VIPATGGVPKQLTFYPARGPLPQRWGYDNQVHGWSNDGTRVLFRSMREGWDLTGTRLYLVSVEGGLPEALPMPVSGAGDLSPDGSKVVYTPLTRDFRTWKRYEGGWAQDLWIFDQASRTLEPVAHTKRTERDPMWIGDRIYFVSDRDGTLNLYSFDPRSKEVEQLTRSTTWDVRWASRGESGEIIYELNGELVVYDTRTKRERTLSLTVPNDGVAMRPSRVSAKGHVEDFGLSPKGERALFSARGDLFTAPIEKGATRNLTHSCGAHDRSGSWSPDGRRIAFVSDRTGEEEIYLVSQDGSGEPEQLTSGRPSRKHRPAWSPDGKRIAFSDATGRIWVVTVESKEIVEAARDKGGITGDYVWSPDSSHLAFSLQDENGYRSVHVWSAGDSTLRRVTGEMWNEREPFFDPEGKYLYFLGDREFSPQLMHVEWNYALNRMTQIYALALRKDVPHPFPPESDEVTIAADEKASDSNAEKDDKDGEKPEKKGDSASKEPLRIDWEGLAERVAVVPVPAGNYSGLTANKGSLFYVKSSASYYGREPEQRADLMVFDLKERKASVLIEGQRGYAISSDGSKILARQGEDFGLWDASPKGKDSKKSVATDGLLVDRVPSEEWEQIFGEVWRRFRDYFYAPNMHGYDWEALRARYAEWLPFVAHRSDLNYVLGEMVAELNVSHAYVSGGDWQVPERQPVALLGCRFELDRGAGRYRIARILRGHNEEERYRSPLTEIGVEVAAGDFLLAIDGVDLPADRSLYQLLRGKADRPIELLVSATPDPERGRRVVVKPVSSEQNLAYLDWVLERRDIVDRLSGGRLGYLHLPNMGAEGIREFIKWFYGQIRKDGLVVDVRNNGGGNVSQMILERLRRNLLGTEYSRHGDFAGTYPQTVFTGPMVCLLNENSASDGDIFPWMFREAKLGPLVGKRSWGGVVGITDHGPLIDGGSVHVPEFGHASASGEWAVEGHGVDPDIVVENDPRSVLEGLDPQLERGVQILLEKLGARSAKLPPRPADPVKTR